MRIMIGALSCWPYKERRDRCAQTWMQEGDKLNGTSPGEPPQHLHTIVRSVFLIGSPGLEEPALAGRYLLLPGPSDYRSLPQRTRAFCQWAISRDDWDYLFKCDDDTYVSIPRLIRYPLTADYIGAEWTPGVRFASGGAGYFLSRKAAEVVAEHLTRKEGYEDVYVRDALASQGIPFTQDQRFVALGNEELRPRADNDLITLHCVPSVPADLFYKSHQECTSGEPPETKALSEGHDMSSGARHVWTVAEVANAVGPSANVRNYLEQRGVRRCLETAAAIKPIRRACDVGCGYGRLTMVLTEVASEVVGFEREPGLMQIASRLLPAATFRQVESLLSLPATSGSFEFAMTFTVLQHLSDEDARGTLAEVKRLARGGFVLLTEETDPRLVASEDRGMFTIGRSEQTYCEWMKPYERILSFVREIEPGYHRNDVGTFMLFADKSHQPKHLDPYPPLSPRLTPEDLLCLKEGQQQLTRMLKYLFEEVCEPLGIQALAWGGTLIGAVNYGGWVPWDADADILVHRDDFERFKAQIRASCPSDFWYQSRETDPHYKPTNEKLRFLHAHYAGSERYPWHGGLQVDINQFWIEDGVFVTSAPDNDATLGRRLREEHILPSIELLFDGVRLKTFRDPAAYLRVRYRTEPLQSERNVPVEARYPHEGAVRLGASAADRARYPQLYEKLYKDQT